MTASWEDRRPPYSEDAEQAVLAAMLIDERAAVSAITVVDDTMFYAERHRRLFRAMADLTAAGTTIDPLTLANRLATHGDLEAAGGKDYIGFLVDAVPTAANIEHHARIVREKAMLRRVIEAAIAMQGEAQRQACSATEIARAAFASLLPMTVEHHDRGFRLVSDDLSAVLEEIEARAAGKATGLLTGYARIDAETGGFNQGELLIVGAAEGMGKSAFALNLALRCASGEYGGGGEAAIVSAEMSRRALIQRCLAWASRMDGRKFRTGKLVDDDYPRMARGAGVLSHLPIWIDDQAEPTFGDIVAKCTALKSAHPKLKMLVVDFLQLVKLKGSEQNRNEQLTEIAYGLHGLGQRLEAVVVAPCQVNTKEVERGSDMRPQPKDLQGSSGMRQAADFITLLYRPEVYDSTLDASELEARFPKCRDASPFTAHLRWDGPTMTISDPPKVGRAA